jgi:hypothetical protein
MQLTAKDSIGMTDAEMGALVSELVEQQHIIFALLEFEERPIVRPPADKESLHSLQDRLAISGRWLPDSYATFLRVCDGIENFCASYSLLGARDILDESYNVVLNSILERGIGYDYKKGDMVPVMIA